jgi:cytidine deaminase
MASRMIEVFDEPEVGMWVVKISNGSCIGHRVMAVHEDSFEVQCAERGLYGKLFTKWNGRYSDGTLFMRELDPAFKPCTRCESRMRMDRDTKTKADLESTVRELERRVRELESGVRADSSA